MSPRSAAANRQLRETAREKLLSSSIRVFAAKGFHGASMEDVAATAGVSKGLVYVYFRSKEELFVHALRSRVQHLFEIGTAIDPALPPRQRLDALLAAAVDRVRREPDVFRLYLAMSLEKELAPVARSTLRALEAPMGRYLAVFRGIFSDAGSPDPDLDALTFRTAVLGLLLRLVRGIEELPVERMVERLADAFMPRVPARGRRKRSS